MSVSHDTAAHALLQRAGDEPGRDEGSWRGSWRRRAACRGEDPELLFPAGSAGRRWRRSPKRRKICARCAVRGACLVFAMATGQEYRIWAD
ncbi:MAG: WhiB family transcriptional regulator [Streptosporangiaceae bacterium]